MRILTYGATGVQGGPVAERLAIGPHAIRALVRDPARARSLADAGVEVVPGDLGDRASLEAASRDVDAVFFHLPLAFDHDLGFAYGRNVVDAARSAGVRLLVFNAGSIVPTSDTGLLHLDLKRAIEGYCVSVAQPTISLRPRLYFEVLAADWVRTGIVEGGTLAYPLPAHYRASWCSVEDVAALALAALERPDLAGSRFEVGGPHALSGPELASILSRVCGTTIAYRAVPVREFRAGLQLGLGDRVGAIIAESFVFFEESGPTGLVVDDAAARTFGVSLMAFEDWAERHDWSRAAVTVHQQRGSERGP